MDGHKDCNSETPSNFEQQGNTYSHYKAYTTAKFLIGCTPNRAICFVNDFYFAQYLTLIVERSGLIDMLEEGDLVLTDRGFPIQDMTDQKHISLRIPAFMKGRSTLSPQEEISTKEIAANRIFVGHDVG